MLTIGQDVHESLHKENLHKIHQHLRQLTPLDKMLVGERMRIDDSPVHDYTIAIRKLTSNPFLPKALIILDDVWDEKGIKPYDQLGLLCLVTSRKSHLLNGIRDRCLKVSIELIWMQCNEYIQYVYIIMKSALFIYSLRFPCQLVLLKIIPNSFGVNNLVICNHSV